MKICVIVPTLNEEKNIYKLFKKIKKTKVKLDVLFIDDNSLDKTQSFIKELKKKNKNIKYIFRKNRTGIGSAHKAGIKFCYKKKYDLIITMDGDGTHDPKYLKLLIDESKNFDMVVTSRFLEKNSLENWPLFRVFLTTLRHLTISLLLSIPYDSSGAFRCINRQKIALSDLILAKNNGYSYFWESIFILHRKKYRITQIPIHLPFRIYGSSKMRIRDIYFSIYYLMIVFLKRILGKYNFK